jgi:hypothetical protein
MSTSHSLAPGRCGSDLSTIDDRCHFIEKSDESFSYSLALLTSIRVQLELTLDTQHVTMSGGHGRLKALKLIEEVLRRLNSQIRDLVSYPRSRAMTTFMPCIG